MNVEQTVIKSILTYPLLYKDINYKYSREKVLEHLFIVNGNGYDWVNGELIYEGLDNNEDILEIPDRYFETPVMSTEEDESDYIRRWRINNGKPYVPHEIKSINALTFYPLCEYAKILNLPDNIKEDWLLAAEEIVILGIDYWNDPYKHFRSAYIENWSESREYDKIHAYVKEQLNFFGQAEKRIKELKS